MIGQFGYALTMSVSHVDVQHPRSQPPSLGLLFVVSFFVGPLGYWGARSAVQRAWACGADSDRYWRTWATGWIAGTLTALVVVFVTPTLTAAEPSPSYAEPAGAPPAAPPNANPSSSDSHDVSPAPAQLSATASCVSPTGQDSAGNVFDYEPARAIDGQADTAWRCDHDGVGQTLTIHFGQTVRLTGMGIIPGFAKVDPYDGTDRYLQSRRISSVRYQFDDGSTVDQNFDLSSGSRDLQTTTFTPRQTSSVAITIVSSIPGQTVNGFAPVDKVAISEVRYTTA